MSSNPVHNNVYSIQTLCDKSLLATCYRSVVFSGYSGSLHQQNWPPWYNSNIVESGVKHHKPNQYDLKFFLLYTFCKGILTKLMQNVQMLIHGCKLNSRQQEV